MILICIFYFKVRNKLKEKRLNSLTVISVAVAVLVMLVDIQMAGILMRYFCDFGIFLIIPAIIIFLSFMEMSEDKPMLKMIWQKLLFVAALMTSGMGFLWVMAI